MKRLGLSLIVCIGLSVAPAFAQQSVVAGIRGRYPTPLAERHGAFLVEVACSTGKGLLKKDWGTFVRLPDGTGVAQDIVMERDGRHYDILGDGENTAQPRWDLVTEPPTVDTARYYAPTCGTPPAPTPEPPLLTDALLREIIEGLAMLETRVNAIDSTSKVIHADLLELKARPLPCLSGRVGGAVPVTVCPK